MSLFFYIKGYFVYLNWDVHQFFMYPGISLNIPASEYKNCLNQNIQRGYFETRMDIEIREGFIQYDQVKYCVCE